MGVIAGFECAGMSVAGVELSMHVNVVLNLGCNNWKALNVLGVLERGWYCL